MKTAQIECYLDSARGIYIPQAFAKQTRHECVKGVSAEDWEILVAGPDGEYYWDTWSDVLDNATLTDPQTGFVYRLEQDGDLFLIPSDWEWNDDEQKYEPPESETLRRYELYSHWASYIFNGDASGLSEDDVKEVEAFFEKEGLKGWTEAEVSQSTWFGSPDCGGLKGTVARYTFVKV